MILIKIMINGFYNLKDLELFQVVFLLQQKIKINVVQILFKIYFLYLYKLKKHMLLDH